MINNLRYSLDNLKRECQELVANKFKSSKNDDENTQAKNQAIEDLDDKLAFYMMKIS